MEGVHIWHTDNVCMTMKFSDQRYDIVVKGQGQMYLKYLL